MSLLSIDMETKVVQGSTDTVTVTYTDNDTNTAGSQLFSKTF